MYMYMYIYAYLYKHTYFLYNAKHTQEVEANQGYLHVAGESLASERRKVCPYNSHQTKPSWLMVRMMGCNPATESYIVNLKF